MASVWKGHIAFGLVSVPVKLACAARSESVSFNELRKSDLEPVGRKSYVKSDGSDIAPADVVKGYKTGKGWVIVTPEEIKALAPSSAHVAEITEFVPIAQVDPVNYESAYWIAPDEGGSKAYALLYDGLKRSGAVAIAKITMSSREHVLAIRAGKSGIVAHTLFYAHEARATEEYRTDLGQIGEAESELASSLIAAYSGTFDASKFSDGYREKILALIASKESGAAPPKPEAQKPQAAAVDIMAALKASLAARKAA